jgi:hypothetical protein
MGLFHKREELSDEKAKLERKLTERVDMVAAYTNLSSAEHVKYFIKDIVDYASKEFRHESSIDHDEEVERVSVKYVGDTLFSPNGLLDQLVKTDKPKDKEVCDEG